MALYLKPLNSKLDINLPSCYHRYRYRWERSYTRFSDYYYVSYASPPLHFLNTELHSEQSIWWAGISNY